MKTYFFNSTIHYGSNMYVVESSGEFAVIDPSRPFAEISELIGLSTEKCKYILLTHAHFDHMLFLKDWNDNTGCPVSVSSLDLPALTDSFLNCYKLFMNSNDGYFGDFLVIKNGDVLQLGEDTINLISTPGHTKGSLAFITDDSIFVGDTVFADGGVGRCDLPGGDYTQLLKSIEKLRNIQKDLIVYPGHGPKTNLSKI